MLQPSDLISIAPHSSVAQKSEVECSVFYWLKLMAKHGDTFRVFTQDEYKNINRESVRVEVQKSREKHALIAAKWSELGFEDDEHTITEDEEIDAELECRYNWYERNKHYLASSEAAAAFCPQWSAKQRV